MLVKCPNCKGARKLMSIGGMYKACPHCQGAGQIEVEEKKVTYQELESALDVFKKYPEEPEKHYKEIGIQDKTIEEIKTQSEKSSKKGSLDGKTKKGK